MSAIAPGLVLSPTSAAHFQPFWYVVLLACLTTRTAAQATPGPPTYYELAEKGRP